MTAQPAVDDTLGAAPIAVLGLGNRLLSDEGVGVVAAERLGELGLAGVDVLDGGTLGLALLPAIEGRRCLLVLDAVSAPDAKPGDVLLLTGDKLRPAWRRCASAHQLGVPDLLAVAELIGRAPATVAAVAMVPGSVRLGWGLSEITERQLPTMVAAALSVLRLWGVCDA